MRKTVTEYLIALSARPFDAMHLVQNGVSPESVDPAVGDMLERGSTEEIRQKVLRELGMGGEYPTMFTLGDLGKKGKKTRLRRKEVDVA